MALTPKERMAICYDCEKLNKARFCKVCKCFMPIKTKIDFLHCPDKKW